MLLASSSTACIAAQIEVDVYPSTYYALCLRSIFLWTYLLYSTHLLKLLHLEALVIHVSDVSVYVCNLQLLNSYDPSYKYS
jgi:hypothetical protein